MNTNEHINSYLSGQATKDEIAELLTWVQASDEHRQEFEEACHLWYSLNTPKFNSNKAFENFSHKTSRKTKTFNFSFWSKVCAAAAVVLLCIGYFGFFKTQNANTISITNDNQTILTVTLPDSSFIYLQQGSSVSYTENYIKKREISIQGNAFCDIHHDETSPFNLSANNYSVAVLGTSFHINTIDSSFVIVESGKVRVSTDKESVIIVQGERADISANKDIVASKNHDTNFLSWKTGKLRFQNKKLTNVLNDVARHYHCTLSYDTNCDNFNTISYTGSFDNASIEEVLTTIELTIPEIQLTKTDDKIYCKNGEK